MYNELLRLRGDRNIPIVITGDFNTNLNGSPEEWRELKFIYETRLNDAWFVHHKGNISEHPGNTEDTDTNYMRWNFKFMEKHFRYDGFLYDKGVRVDDIKVIGDIPIPLNPTQSDAMKKLWIPEGNDEKIKYNDMGTLDLFPSDHYGVCVTFVLE